MDSNEKAQRAIILQQQKLQKETQLAIFKQDCRRTAIQLSERFSKDPGDGGKADVVTIIANAELVYMWLINFDKPMSTLEEFKQTGVIKSKK